MTQTRRRLVSGLAAATLLVGAASAQAWSWSYNSGERVQGSGEIVSETRTPGSFEAISMSGHFKVLVRQSGNEAIELRADKNVLPLIETRIVDGSKGRVLEVGIKRGYSVRGTSTPTLTIDVKTLRALTLAGAGDVKIEALKSDQFDASVAGSGDMVLMGLEVPRVGIKVSGSGDVQASGRADTLAISVAGSGDVKAADLQADEVKVSVAGSGDAQVHALKQLKVSVAGSGDVRYRGSPNVDSSVAGSGTVKKLVP
jgi:hypothetical protein